VEPELKPIYWSSAEEPLSVYRCATEGHCPGGEPGDACGRRLEGRACAYCRDGYAWSGEACKACSSLETTSFVFPALPLILCPVMALLLYKMFGDGYSKWNKWQNSISSVVFLVMNHYQIVNMLKASNIVLPDSSAGVFEAAGVTTDLSSIFSPRCAGFKSFNDSLAIKVIAPAVAGLQFAGVWLLFWVLSRMSKVPTLDHNRLANVYLSLVFTFFGGIVDTSSSMFKCGPNPNGSKTLMSDRSMVCFEEEWNSMLGIGLVGVVCWVVGFGALFVWAVVRAPIFFKDPGLQMRWKFLFIKYRADVHWWAIVFVAKGVLLNAGYLFLETGNTQLIWVLLINTAYLWGTVVFRPWRHIMLNLLDPTMHSFLMIITTAFMWFARTTVPEGVDLDSDMNSIIIGMTLAVWPVAGAVALASVALQKLPYLVARRKAAIDYAINVLTNVSAISKEELMKDFAQFVDMDLFFVYKAAEALGNEVLSVRARSGICSKELAARQPGYRRPANADSLGMDSVFV